MNLSSSDMHNAGKTTTLLETTASKTPNDPPSSMFLGTSNLTHINNNNNNNLMIQSNMSNVEPVRDQLTNELLLAVAENSSILESKVD